jgi:hypothetical protein
MYTTNMTLHRSDPSIVGLLVCSKLREMVVLHGEGDWVAISTGLPGRTGKKRRARWMNNLRPDINKV